MKTTQKGAIPLPILIAAIGIMAFLGITFFSPFKDTLLSSIFPKEESFAATFSTPGFAETRWVNNLNAPTAMEFSPDGRLFISQQGGQLRVVKNGQLLSTPFVSITVDSNNERGLLGIAFDPNFATNNFVYVYYTTTNGGINRISRFTANGDVAISGSETVIMDLDSHGAQIHNGGAMHFGKDGKLYVATGDNGSGSNAQIVTNRHGKMLRLNPVPDNPSTTTVDERIPSDNPASFDTANGVVTPTGVNKAIWNVGLRNPFTFDIQDGTGRIFINDVGDNGSIRWEEINEATAGNNFGWSVAYGNSGDQNAKYKKPIHTYQSPGCAITGGAFYNAPSSAPTPFPSQYIGKYFFADYCGGFIRYFDPNNPGTINSFASGINFPIDIKDGPDGALYYLTRGDNSVYRVVAGAVPSPSPTPPPIPNSTTITFDDRAGQDQPLNGEYPTGVINWGTNSQWIHSSPWEGLSTKNFSFNGQSITTASFTILNNKRLARLTAYNGNDSSSSTVNISCPGQTTKTASIPSNDTLLIDTGWTSACSVITLSSSNGWDTNFDDLILADAVTGSNQPPTATINTPTSNTQYTSGQTVNFTGTGSDPEDGTLSPGSLNWVIQFHHNDPGSQAHTHPVLGEATLVTGNTGSFIASTDHSTVNAFYRISLTATDSQGQKTTVSRDINPKGTNLTITSNPVGLQVTLNSIPMTTPYSEGSVVGYSHQIGTSTPQTLNNITYNFNNWSDDGAITHTATAPDTNTTFTANFTTASPSPSPKPGDIDGNTKVDIFDYNILLTNFGKTGTGLQGDLDNNQKVDVFDYNILLTNFGK